LEGIFISRNLTNSKQAGELGNEADTGIFYVFYQKKK